MAHFSAAPVAPISPLYFPVAWSNGVGACSGSMLAACGHALASSLARYGINYSVQSLVQDLRNALVAQYINPAAPPLPRGRLGRLLRNAHAVATAGDEPNIVGLTTADNLQDPLSNAMDYVHSGYLALLPTPPPAHTAWRHSKEDPFPGLDVDRWWPILAAMVTYETIGVMPFQHAPTDPVQACGITGVTASFESEMPELFPDAQSVVNWLKAWAAGNIRVPPSPFHLKVRVVSIDPPIYRGWAPLWPDVQNTATWEAFGSICPLIDP